MPRPRKPPRLLLRKDRDGSGGQRKVWIIRDGGRDRRTGCLEADAERAAEALADYIGTRRQAPDGERRAHKILIGDVLKLYLKAKVDSIARPAELIARIGRLNEELGVLPVSAIIGETCRAYVAARAPARIAARRELETLRAACRYFAKERGLDVTPAFDLPEDSTPRERWLTRQDAAALLLATLGFVRDEETGHFARRKGTQKRHLARFILIGLYTGTRHRAILGLKWMPNTTGGHVDLEHGVLYRRADRARRTRKRQPPARIPPRLLAHLKRWHRLDGGTGPVVRYMPVEKHRLRAGIRAEGMTRIEKGFRGARKAAGLPDDVTPHVLRHTRATWLMQRGVDLFDAAQSLGMTVKTLEDVYGHHHPDFQKQAAEAY